MTWRHNCKGESQVAYEVPDINPERNELRNTVKIEDLATAMGKTASEFKEQLPALLALGFPSPDDPTGEFDLGRVLDWVLESQTLCINILTMLTEKLTINH